MKTARTALKLRQLHGDCLVVGTRTPNAVIAGTALIMAFLGGSMPAFSQTLSDPTQPPAAWLASRAKGGTPMAPEVADQPPKLQSLLLGGPRKYAIIDGQLLGVGDRYKDAEVVSVNATEVMLRSEQGTRTLKLFPDVVKAEGKSSGAEKAGNLKPGAAPSQRIVIKEMK